MAQFPPPRTSSAVVHNAQAPTMAVLVAYLLFGLASLTQIGGSGIAVPAPLLTLIGVIGVIVAYVKRAESRGTWVESHMTSLISMFWWSTVWALVGWLLFATIIGIPVALLLWAVVAIWVLYRVIKGVMYYNKQQPIPL